LPHLGRSGVPPAGGGFSWFCQVSRQWPLCRKVLTCNGASSARFGVVQNVPIPGNTGNR
jgi:hypothetical protein